MTNEKAIELLDNLIGMVSDSQDNDYDTALKLAIEALKQNQWIPCSERPPEVGEDVFISVGERVCEAHLRESAEYFLTHKTKALVAEWEVDAWMPLPKSWKETQNE